MTGRSRARWAVFCLTAAVAAGGAYVLFVREHHPPSGSPASPQNVRRFSRFLVTRAGIHLLLVAAVIGGGAAAYGALSQENGAPSAAHAVLLHPSVSPTPAVAAATWEPMPTAAATQEPTPGPTPTRPPLVLVTEAPWAGPANIPILMYHHVTDAPPTSEMNARLTVTEADFARQLAYLRCAGYYSITLSQLFDSMYNGAPLPEKPVILTFDDGYADAYAGAFPHLNGFGFGGTFAIVTGWVGQPAYLTWAQIQEMAAAGMEMAAHSVSHPDFGVQPDDVVLDQLSRSRRDLEEKLGQPVAFFVYPAGEPFRSGTAERQAQVVAMVQEAGYRGALTAKWNLAQDPAAPFALNRVRVSGGVDIGKFAENMGGPSPEAIGC